MIEITDKRKCCGCEACKNICPKNCITMIEDEEGFRYPHIDKEKCINCKLCEKVCPMLNEATKENDLPETEFYAAYNNNENILKQSSSGGIFWLLVEWTLNKKGVVYGVIQKDTYDIKFARAENEKECEAFRKSKYLQANVNDIYKQVKQDLENDKFVLFSRYTMPNCSII